MHKKGIILLSLLLIALASCSEAPKKAQKAKEPDKPAEPVTGRFAFHQMFAAARSWSPDIETLKLNSINLPGVKHVDGKASAWQVVFVSQAKQRSKSWTYSVVEAEGNLHKGVFAGLEESYSGPRGATKPFLVAALKEDSDQAYKVATGKAADYMKKNPDMEIVYQLELSGRNPNPAWRVIWGDSVSHSNFSILVDASTGQYVSTLH
jgi:hypothetical protein